MCLHTHSTPEAELVNPFPSFPDPATAELRLAVYAPLIPILELQTSIPFGSTIMFFAVYFGVAMNQSLSRYVRCDGAFALRPGAFNPALRNTASCLRFNAMQAMLLDIALIIPSLLESVLGGPRGGPTLQLYILFYNTIWLFCE